MKSYLSVPKVYSVKLRVIAVDAGGGGAKSHRGTPSRGLEWAGFEAAPATDPTGRRTVHFTKTLLFLSPRLTYDTSLRHIRYLEVARI